MMDQRKSISGGSEESQKQMQIEVRAIPKQERQKLLSEAGVGVEMTASQALAIKADLAIPWYRADKKRGGEVFRMAAVVWVEDLEEKIVDMQ